jgi:hypothetical protein
MLLDEQEQLLLLGGKHRRILLAPERTGNM